MPVQPLPLQPVPCNFGIEEATAGEKNEPVVILSIATHMGTFALVIPPEQSRKIGEQLVIAGTDRTPGGDKIIAPARPGLVLPKGARP